MPHHDSDGEGPNIVDQVLHDGDDDADRLRDDDDEEGAYVRESGELNLNDNVGADDAHSDIEDGHKRKSNIKLEAAGNTTERKKEHSVCCTQCLSKNRNNGRACICQVPSKQRRGSLGRQFLQIMSLLTR
jgi:hypothetical protein